jgi:omega-6 fatty acid desaturase (delta-12 desaturase)
VCIFRAFVSDKRSFTHENKRIVCFTYLQHSDPTIPYYRKVRAFVDSEHDFANNLIQDQWTFARGALATVDRPLFGWVGRFFFHNVGKEILSNLFVKNIPREWLADMEKNRLAVITSHIIFSQAFHFVRTW